MTVMDPLVVPKRAVAVLQHLAEAGIGSALGGALALGFHVEEPRATRDVDINITLPRREAPRALQALPEGPEWGPEELATIARDGQVRLLWDVPDGTRMPLDLFFAEHPFHTVVAERTVTVSLLGAEVQIISATDLVVFKALSARRKDWADIEEVVRHAPPSFDLAEAVRWLVEILGPDDTRIGALRSLAAEFD